MSEGLSFPAGAPSAIITSCRTPRSAPRSLMRFVRPVAVVLLWLALAQVATAQVTYSVTFVDPNNLSTAQDRANMAAAINATGADWARYFQTPGPINLSVQLTMDNSFPRATGR